MLYHSNTPYVSDISRMYLGISAWLGLLYKQESFPTLSLPQGFFAFQSKFSECHSLHCSKKMVLHITKLLSWFLLIIPCYARILDISKLLKTSKKIQEPRFTHNVSACTYRFHDYAFLALKQVNLTDEKHFKGRLDCSVEFFNLPKGIFYVTMGNKNIKRYFFYFWTDK